MVVVGKIVKLSSKLLDRRCRSNGKDLKLYYSLEISPAT